MYFIWNYFANMVTDYYFAAAEYTLYEKLDLLMFANVANI